jgi:Bacterial PH domain
VYQPELRLSVIVLTGLTVQVFWIIFAAAFFLQVMRPSLTDLPVALASATSLAAVLVIGIKYAFLRQECSGTSYRVVGDRVELEEDGRIQLSVRLADVVTIVLRQNRLQRRHALGSIYLVTSYVLPKRSRLPEFLGGSRGGGLVIPDIRDAERLFENLAGTKGRIATEAFDPESQPAKAAVSVHKPVFVLSSVFWDLAPQLLFMAFWWTGVLTFAVGMPISLATRASPAEIEPWFIYLVPAFAMVVICFFGGASDAIARAYRQTSYRIGHDHIVSEAQGVLVAERRYVHFSDVEGAALYRNWWQRWRGLGTIHIEAASMRYRMALLVERPLGGSEASGLLLRDLPDWERLHARLAAMKWRPKRALLGPGGWAAGEVPQA